MSAKHLERKFSKPTQISKHLYCSICTDVFLDPIRLFCGHTFCTQCITSWGKSNNSCPVCRSNIDNNLIGKDLLAEKIIQDLEVLCVNKLCDWKDRLENLPKHVKNCAFAKTPEWLNEAQSKIQIQDGPAPDKYMEADEQFIERVNEEVPRKSLLERLYTKNEESQKLVKSVFSNSKKKVNNKKAAQTTKVDKAKSFAEYDDFLCALGDSDEDTKEEQFEPLTLEVTPKDSPKSEARLSHGVQSAPVSDKNSLDGKGDANNDTIMEEEPLENIEVEHTTPPNRRRTGRRKAGPKLTSEPGLVKKTKTTV